ncbi:hypothetical protein HMPREF2547_08125 [Corynebacterium sp. HMSC055G02]|uniref:hypothetical protein n=1 Tax=Corynebacterium TaxID=1716 RepID=UPI0008A528FF|nr:MULTISPECIES: hypothetical protein [Corynebacterium]MBC6797401.1 hypothetical protein [Corynebacterium sp. LK31]MBC6830849.1 hypothetical protein [Corynebacterium sp. LK32]MDK8819934.1 hypothetical protein [Corynebacterium amycolatum]OFN54989.1 hypothetical protein HMPREF2547_08125 [Corynebacterium sp. HMSC055G02]
MDVNTRTQLSAVQRPQLTAGRRKNRQHLALACCFLTFAATATSCANSESKEVAATQTSSSGQLTTVSTTSSPTTTGPKVREGGTPRIGQLCPNQTGEIRMSANGQNLECAQVGEQEVWTVLQQTPANPTSQQMWISTTPTTTEPQPQEPEPTTPSESATETSVTESSTTSDSSTPPDTSTTPTTSGEPTESESEQEEQPGRDNQGLTGLFR